MDSIYEYLRRNQTPEAFDACVKRFSDEKQPFWVSWLQMPVEFENVAFELSAGEVSQPFFTPQGIHIVKVIERMEMPSFDDVKNGMEVCREHTHILSSTSPPVLQLPNQSRGDKPDKPPFHWQERVIREMTLSVLQQHIRLVYAGSWMLL